MASLIRFKVVFVTWCDVAAGWVSLSLAVEFRAGSLSELEEDDWLDDDGEVDGDVEEEEEVSEHTEARLDTGSESRRASERWRVRLLLFEAI